jgi:sugar phosphate isomerase/epimerase
MKLGTFTVLFSHLKFEDMLDHVKAKGIEAVEIGTGGYPGDAHCKPAELLADEGKLRAFKKAIDDRGLTLGALSCHANPLSPDRSFAEESHQLFLQTVQLAEKLEVPVINCFSGTPGDHEHAKYPNWPVVTWPIEYRDVLNWQWNEKIIPYWREAVGEVIGANLDPSHMWWQGIDPVAAVKILGRENAIHHFHAKDTSLDQEHVNMYGITDMQPFENLATRAWQFRTVGFGHDLKTWADILSSLRVVGYDYVVSIEHEDAFFSADEGFQKAVDNLKQVIPHEPLPKLWWND